MIEAKLIRDKGILVITPVLPLQPQDFAQVRALADPFIQKHGGLKGVLIDAESFPGWKNFSAMLSHIRLVDDYQHKVERVAAVTDIGFLAILPKVIGHFISAEVRHFAYEDRDVALNWLHTGVLMPANKRQ